MKAGVWLGPENVQVMDRPIPEVIPGSLLLKVQSCAVCGSDLRIYKHGNERVKPSRIIGHEISGEIVKVGEGVTKFKVGDRVSVGADVPCGKCDHCLNDRPNCCDVNLAMGYQFDGGFAEYVRLDPVVVEFGPVQKFNSDLDYDMAALAEPLACCINGYERGLMENGKSVVIFGAGPIGTMLALLAPYYESKTVIVIDPSETRLEIVKKITGAITINPTKEDPVKKVMELTNQRGAGMIFTACPAVETHAQAIQMVEKRGVVNLFGGLPKGTPQIMLDSNWIHYREAYITGSHGSTPKQHKKALDLIQTGKVNVKPLLSHQFTLDELPKAFATAMSKEGLKVVIKPNG